MTKMARLALALLLAVPLFLAVSAGHAQDDRDLLKVVQARDVPVDGGTNSVARLMRLDAGGNTVWSADTWVGYPLKGPGEYYVAVVRDQALVRFPLGPDQRVYAAAWATGAKPRLLRPSDPLVREADSANAWSDMRVMPFDPPLSAPAQGTAP
ncbi:MAG: hypothetical protein GC201_05830 [Alphaproteobacteria bacterium]|nr:hypothetical protein [Alphaproteobacteria bacterium]